MRTRMLRNILSHLRGNINAGLESLEEARSYAGKMDGLTDDERLFLEVAFLDGESAEALYRSISRPIPRSSGTARETKDI